MNGRTVGTPAARVKIASEPLAVQPPGRRRYATWGQTFVFRIALKR